MGAVSRIPPFRDFVARRFAVRSPFWSWLLFERAGGALAYVFARMGTSPSTVTLLGGASGITGATVLGTATDPEEVAVAAGLLLLAYTLDCSDGQLARATGRTSARGAWLDVMVDGVVVAFLSASLCFALTTDDPSPWSLLLAGAFGASRVASLFTATSVRSAEGGGIHLTGSMALLRIAFVAATDTPFVYAVLCVSRLSPGPFRAVIIAVTTVSLAKMLVSAHRHFRSRPVRDAVP